MTSASRWLMLIPVVLVAAAIPFMLAMRDPLDDARSRLASMTPAQRKEIERNRESYDRLTSLEQYELRQFNDELAKVESHERTKLEATMGRLQAFVGAFPDDVRAKYDKGMSSERIAILKAQRKSWEDERGKLVAQVQRADQAAKQAGAGKPSPGRLFDPKRLEKQIPAVEQWARLFGTEDDQRLVKLVKESDRLNPFDKRIALVSLSGQGNAKGMGKRLVNRGEPPDIIPIGMFRQFSFIPAFARLPEDPKKGLPDENRAEISKAIVQLYLLKPPEPPMDGEEIHRRLDLGQAFRAGLPMLQPIYLIQQIALLKDYADGKRTPPKQDQIRVRFLLRKSP